MTARSAHPKGGKRRRVRTRAAEERAEARAVEYLRDEWPDAYEQAANTPVSTGVARLREQGRAEGERIMERLRRDHPRALGVRISSRANHRINRGLEIAQSKARAGMELNATDRRYLESAEFGAVKEAAHTERKSVTIARGRMERGEPLSDYDRWILQLNGVIDPTTDGAGAAPIGVTNKR
ncbi:MAG: hypothetical protein LKI58_11255 [Actinomyces sp.]|jgi:hypothetical protein|nr:hypothetical protein [Actinomyces sp.]MCI1788616.1 hypothetical protein [Actinomyces sp.]MCI1829718.1 hypothetical protein [Actinomyces sp.]